MQWKRSQAKTHAAIVLALCTLGSLTGRTPALAQGSPIPGDGSSHLHHPAHTPGSAPIPGGKPTYQTNATAAPAHQAPPSIYHQLPLNAEEARIKLEELSNRLAVSRPDDIKDSIYALSEWLQDVADAHWRMYKAFEKTDATRAQANKEKEIGIKFSQLKNRAKLLKADLFIKQNRYPEALGPLVEIVTAEPTSTTGQEAYKRLVDMGFSEHVPNVELAEKGANQKR